MYKNDETSLYLVTEVCLLEYIPWTFYINCILTSRALWVINNTDGSGAEWELMEYYNELIIGFVLINYTSFIIGKLPLRTIKSIKICWNF